MPRRPESARERFEAWWYSTTQYCGGDRLGAWAAWQAARAEALEEAAVECEYEAGRHPDRPARIGPGRDACLECADDIRALKDKEPA